MRRTFLAFLALLCAGVCAARADQTTSTVQQALKDQGFYYGEINGKKDAGTTAAIRRYQIRNGLQITGEIDAETLRSLGVGSGTAPAPKPRAEPTAAPGAPPPDSDEAPGQSAEIPPAGEPVNPPPDNRYLPGLRGPRPDAGGVFDGTPYEMAPPDVQRHVIIGVQALLARAGFYRSGVDGEFGPATVAAVRAFQVRAGLPADGRLNMETLSALGLLPGQRPPHFPLRHPPPLRRPIYRGQWIPG